MELLLCRHGLVGFLVFFPLLHLLQPDKQQSVSPRDQIHCCASVLSLARSVQVSSFVRDTNTQRRKNKHKTGMNLSRNGTCTVLHVACAQTEAKQLLRLVTKQEDAVGHFSSITCCGSGITPPHPTPTPPCCRSSM